MKNFSFLILIFCSHYLLSQNKIYIPINLNDGWIVDSAFQKTNLISLNDSLENHFYEKIDGILVIKDGRLIFERYFNGYSPFILHDTRSATKSITSLLVGKAIDLNHIKSENELLTNYFPEYELNSKSLNIKEVLMMRSGLDCNDWNPDSDGNEQKMSYSKDWYKHIVELKMEANPGEKFSYCTGSFNLLAKVLEESSQVSVEDFSRSKIFRPLGIEDYNWYTNTHNFKPYLGGGLFLNLRDFAKFGQLILNQGYWAESQVISKDWIEKILISGKEVNGNQQQLYSYGWWLEKIESNGKIYDLITASGNGGQKLMIIKELGLVVALFGNGYGDPFFEAEQPKKILKNHFLNMK